MMPRSLTSRLIFLYCVILLLLGGAFLGFTVLSFRHYTREVITNLLSVRSQDIWRLSRPLLAQPAALATIIEQHFSPQSQNRFIRIRIDDRVLYRSGEPSSGYFSAGSVPFTAPAETAVAQLRGQVMLFSKGFTGPHGEHVIVEAGQYQFARTIQTRLTKSLFVGLPILLFIAAFAGWLVMRRALGPIEAMISAAESYSFNQPAKRLPTLKNEPRIEALGMALNRLLDRLDSAYTHVSRFTSDAAHELRTPLTIIRGELELAARRDLPPDTSQAISNILEEMTRLSALVDNLITLSRMDSLWGKTAHARIELKALAVEVVEQMHLLLEEKNISIAPPGGGPVHVLGDRSRLKQVIVNLLDNAIKYTGDNGRITVRIYTEGNLGIIAVQDNGIGIEPAHQQRVFDRFYRVSPDRGAVGAGLGLAIVRSICHAHGGVVSVQSAPGGGSCFIVEIPLETIGVTSRTLTAPAASTRPSAAVLS